jgi:alkylhydroperoxidase/carboxymuconolactone decarboxylase family protein YurZ
LEGWMSILKEIFGHGTGWVETVSRQMPLTHEAYDKLLEDIWSQGVLPQKEKLLVLLGVCLGQGRSEMTRQVMSAISASTAVSDEELMEIVSTVLISRGPVAWFTACEAGVQ